MEDKSLSNKHFQAGDIARILGIDRNRLFYWINTHKFLKPEREVADGTGTRAKFSMKNLIELVMIKEFDDYGIDLKKIRILKDSLDKQFKTKNKVDFYSYILECPEYLRNKLQLKIRQIKNKYSFEFTHIDTDVDLNSDPPQAAPMVMNFEPLENPDLITGRMFYFQLLEIGNLANQVIERVKAE
jgi:DNA-binding transcriptional MerR regulator